MKIFTLPGSIFCTLSLGFLLFSLGCADYPIQNSPTVSRLDSYGIRSETYERITMGEPLSYEDIMNLEACHVPQETINYLYAKQNNDYFKKKYHSCTHHSSQVALEESRECLEAETEKATHKAEDQLQRLADEENRKHLAVEAEARVKEETEKAAHEAEDQLRRLKDEENRKYLAAEAEARVKEEAKKAAHAAKHQLQRLADEENKKHLAAEAEARVKEETEKAAHEAEDQLRRLADEESRKHLAAEAEARVKEEAEKAPREAEHQLRRLKKVF